MNNRFESTNKSFEAVLKLSDFYEIKDPATGATKAIKCELFGYLPYNRVAYSDRPKFKALQSSINNGRMLSPIICYNRNGELIVKDGQGRLVAVYKYLLANKDNVNIVDYKVPVYVNDNFRESDVVEMNNTASPWDLYDYIVSNRDLRDGNCQELLDLFDTYSDYKFKTITTHMSKENDKGLYEGPNKWKPNFSQGKQILDLCRIVSEYDPVLGRNTTFTNGIAFIVRNVNSENIDDIDLNAIPETIKPHHLKLNTLKIKELKIELLNILGSDFVVRGRNILNSAKAQAWDRADGKCEALLHSGKRCNKKNIEYHHDLAHGIGGSNGERNIRILCERHNNTVQTDPIKYFDDE